MPTFYRRLVLPVLLILALFAGRPAQAQTSEGAALDSADSLWQAGQFEASLEQLEALREAGPADADVLWRIARAKGDLGEEAEEDDEKETWYRAALEDAHAAVEADSMSADASLTQAIAAGRVGLISGTKEKVELSREVKESVDRAIELDPEKALAYHVRGRWNYEVASLGFFSRAALRLVYGGLPDASYESAIQDFRRAIELEDQVVHHLELGKAYLKMDDASRAKDELRRAIELENTYPNDPGYKQEAEALLADLD